MKLVPVHARFGAEDVFAMVDDEDFDLVMRRRWGLRDGYVIARGKGKSRPLINMHRLVLGLDRDGRHVHHINGDKRDNRKANLMVVANAAEHKALHKKALA